MLLVGFETEITEGLKSANKKNILRKGAENYRIMLVRPIHYCE